MTSDRASREEPSYQIWIPCSDIMPEDGETVLTIQTMGEDDPSDTYYAPMLMNWKDDNWYWYGGSGSSVEPTHWTPYPEFARSAP